MQKLGLFLKAFDEVASGEVIGCPPEQHHVARRQLEFLLVQKRPKDPVHQNLLLVGYEGCRRLPGIPGDFESILPTQTSVFQLPVEARVDRRRRHDQLVLGTISLVNICLNLLCKISHELQASTFLIKQIKEF